MLTLSHKLSDDKTAGFSLMEVLIVLAIMGLMLSVVNVRLVRTAETTYFNKTADAALSDIVLLRASAVLDEKPLLLVMDDSRLKLLTGSQKTIAHRLELPNGWRVEGDDIFISNTGTCFGGQIVIADNTGRQAHYKLTPPVCESERFSISEESSITQ